ncbi:MAG TPA: D-alanyl-D-alanine carboxypeptidase family protein [Usitatibacteraceae bacterium]|nr:D-alanyl-D-alanine carboxypeptidase family protein [Usitatibacteraceae bacterium]
MIDSVPLHRARFVLLAVLLAAAVPAHAQLSDIPAPPIAARAYVLVDATSNQTLASFASAERFEPASLTKLMTAYLVFQALREKKLKLDQPVAVSERAWRAEGSRMFIDPKQAPSVENLIRGMIIQSGNDASIALAEAVAGSEELFAMAMNKQARALGMKNSQFANATGLPNPQHYSTAEDLALLAHALMRDFPSEVGYYKEREFTWNKITQPNRNRLLWQDPTVDGLKTGHTEPAGYCLVATARRGEADKVRRLVSVVLGTASDVARMQESQKLLNYGYQFFDAQRLYKRNEAVATLDIFKGAQNTVKLGFERDMWLTLPKDRFAGLKATLSTTQPLLAPLQRGQKAGVMKLTQNDKLIAELPVVALEDVPVAGVLGRGWDAIRLLFK